MLGGFGLSVLLFAAVAIPLWGETTPDPVPAAILQTVAGLLAFGALTWFIGFRSAGLNADVLRWRPVGSRDIGFALGLGAVPAVLAMLVAAPLASGGWSLDGGSLLDWLGGVGRLALVLGPAAFLEELVFRGVPLVLVAAVFGRAAAVVGLAVVFGLAHLLNPEATALGVGNVALAGVFLGTAFYLPGGLWAATGAHLGWNLTLAVLAAPVSGLPLPLPGLDYHPGSPAWVSGGPFGPEGGIVATLTLAGATVFAARRTEQEPGA